MDEKLDLDKAVDFLKESYSFETTGSTGEFRADCPFCRDTKKHMYVNFDKKVYNCFRCGAGGMILNLLAELEGKSFNAMKSKFSIGPKKFTPIKSGSLQEAMAKLEKLQTHPPPPSLTFAEIPLPIGSTLLKPENKGSLTPFFNYLIGRGVEEQDIYRCEMYACTSGQYRNRVILPIRMDGTLTGYQGRDITGRSPLKVRNPLGMNKSKMLFNYDTACRYDEIVVLEGPYGAIHAGENAVAVLGKELSYDQARLLEPFKKITICFDANAWEYSFKAVSKLLNSKVFVALLPQDTDRGDKLQPDDLTKDELKNLIQNAIYGRNLSALEAMIKTKLAT